jgi:hypothetical protein
MEAMSMNVNARENIQKGIQRLTTKVEGLENKNLEFIKAIQDFKLHFNKNLDLIEDKFSHRREIVETIEAQLRDVRSNFETFKNQIEKERGEKVKGKYHKIGRPAPAKKGEKVEKEGNKGKEVETKQKGKTAKKGKTVNKVEKKGKKG